jgi:hypothetical protein
MGIQVMNIGSVIWAVVTNIILLVIYFASLAMSPTEPHQMLVSLLAVIFMYLLNFFTVSMATEILTNPTRICRGMPVS